MRKRTRSRHLPIDGIPLYRKEVQSLLFGSEAELVKEGRVVTAQALGGTGALKIGADFLKKFLPTSELYISAPSWENHRAVFETAGFAVKEYAYYSPATHGLDFGAMRSALAALAPRSIVLLHACCHNPTGADLSAAEWQELVELFRERSLFPFIDFAYQGFGDGIDADAVAVRAFTKAKIPCVIASSFSKSFSLYRGARRSPHLLRDGRRRGSKARHLASEACGSCTNYFRARAHTGDKSSRSFFSDPELRERWETELTEMRERIQRNARPLRRGARPDGKGARFSPSS